MSEIQLSVLIPSVPSRLDKLQTIFDKLIGLSLDKRIEVLSLCDNKVQTIGEKRDNLAQLSKGKYFMFVDDDDDVENIEDVYNATFLDVDVITFKSECRNSNGTKYIVTHHLGNAIEHNTDGNGNYIDSLRPPWHCCAWRSKYKQYRFPHVNYAEDWGWLSQFVDSAKTEYFIDKVVYKYNFDILITEASTESNHLWTNPNT